MKLVYVASFLTALFFVSYLPLKALAEMHEVQSWPEIKCGLKCVKETIRFDSKEEAEIFAKKYDSKEYPNDKQQWFVDIQLTEVDAKIFNQ